MSGKLLEVNFNTVYERNKQKILRKAKVFGLGWLGDGATIKQMPLLNMLVMCGGEAPVVVSVCDCTDHTWSLERKRTLIIS